MHQIFSTENFSPAMYLQFFVKRTELPLNDCLNDYHEMIEKTHSNFTSLVHTFYVHCIEFGQGYPFMLK